MKNQILCGIVVCLLAGGMAPAEEQKPGYPFTVEKSIGTAKFADKTYDEVWGAVVKTLVLKGYHPSLIEKDAGIIEAEQVRARGTLFKSEGSQGVRMSVMVEKGDAGISVTLTWYRGKKIVMRSMSAQLNKVYGEFFQAVADILYPPEGAA